MIAFMPTCSCGRESVHASVSDGTSMLGVGDVSGIGVSEGGVGVGIWVGVSAG